MTRPRAGLLLDRDGVLIEAPPEGQYILHPRQVVLRPEGAALVRLGQAAGWPVIVVSNQACVAKGLLTADGLERVSWQITGELRALGLRQVPFFYCTHAEGDRCSCRKPKPGLLLKAARAYALDLRGSVMVGDSWRDREAAARVGCAYAHVGDER